MFIPFLCLLPTIVLSVEHHLYWNTSNPIWKGSDASLAVRMFDRVRIHCPDANKDTRTSYLKVFQVSEFSYAECMLETGKQQVVMCNGNEADGKPRSTILTIRPYSSTPNALTFTVGQYYWLSTSNGKADGLDRSMFGLCKTHQMRLQLTVLERQDRPITNPTTIVAERRQNSGTVVKAASVEETIPEEVQRVSDEQLKAVLSLAREGKTGTYRHNTIQVEDNQSWNPINYYKNYYKQDANSRETIDEHSKDYEIGEESSIGLPYSSYLSSTSLCSCWTILLAVLMI